MTLTAEGQPTLTMTVAESFSLPADQFADIGRTYRLIVRIDSAPETLSLPKDVRINNTQLLTGVNRQARPILP